MDLIGNNQRWEIRQNNRTAYLIYYDRFEIEGATNDANELTVNWGDPTADRTITFPDVTGIIQTVQTATSVSLTSDDQVVTVGSLNFLKLTSNDATASNRTFTLSATGVAEGQEITLLWNDGTNAGELADTGIQKLSSTWTPGQYDIIKLKFDGTNFVECGRSDN